MVSAAVVVELLLVVEFSEAYDALNTTLILWFFLSFHHLLPLLHVLLPHVLV